MFHNTKENINAMKIFLRKRNIELISGLINNKKFNVNLPLNGSKHPTLFHFIYMILNQHEKSIGDQEFEIVKLIIEAKADVNYISNGLNVLTMIYKFKRNINETENIIKLLLDNKADNYNPLLNRSALDYAVKSDCWRSVKLLLKNGIIPDETIFNKYRYHFAYNKGPVTKLLIEYMPSNILLKDIFANRFECDELLCGACNMGCLNAVKQLIKYYISCCIHQQICTFITINTVTNLSLLEIVMLNINEIETSTDQTRKNILGDGKDLDNYIEIAKLLVDHAPYTTKTKSNKLIHSYAVKRKNALNKYLLIHFPKVLINMILKY
jgi:hypothetical protein